MNYRPFAFMLYAVGSLISMGVMSVTAGIAGLSILIPSKEGAGFFSWMKERFKNDQNFRLFSFASVALLISCVLSLVMAWVFPVQWLTGANEVQFKDLLKLWYLFWPFLLGFGISKFSSEQRAQILRVWICAFILLSLIGVIQYFTGWPRPQKIPFRDDLAVRYHAVLFLGQHLSVASILIFPYFFAMDAIADSSLGTQLKIPKSVLVLGVILGTLTLYFTYSRTLWIALPVGVILWFFLRLKRKKKVIGVIAGLVLLGVLSQVPQVRDRLTNQFGITERQTLWKANFSFFLKRPITGVGFGQSIPNAAFYIHENAPEIWKPLISHAHNIFLEVLGSTGLIGFISWVFYMVMLVSLSWKRGWRGLSVAWVVFLINGLTQVNFWESKVLHQVMWVTAWSLLGL